MMIEIEIEGEDGALRRFYVTASYRPIYLHVCLLGYL